jgi:Ca2+:H+ antiporter
MLPGVSSPAPRPDPRSGRPSWLRFISGAQGWPYLLTPLIPIAVGLEVAGGSHTLIFAASALGVIPPAALMGRATEELAARSGPGIGGLLNVTFGNFPELIIAFFALLEGLQEVVKASIIGSIIGNILLVLGAAMFFGGLGRKEQRFHRDAVGAQSAMLLLAVAALVMPAVFQMVDGGNLPRPAAEDFRFSSTIEHLSLAVAIVLIVSYLAGLVFSLRTHRDVFNPEHEIEEGHAPWSTRRSVIALAIAGVAVAVMSEILVGSIADAAKSIGLSEFFIGAIVVAIVGNVAEHWVAVYVARKDQMDLAVNIAIGSSAQIALFVAPLLVLLSFFFGDHPMALVFNGFELAAVVLAVLIANRVTIEGRSNWFEGVQLLSVYLVVAIAFGYAQKAG